MNIQKTTLADLQKIYPHPSAALFRAIELKILWETLKKKTFHGPSVDIGCGDGVIAALLFDKKFTYGVDNGEANDYEVAIKNKTYKKLLLESAEHMSIKNNSVNFVFSNSVIEHIPDNEVVLSEISRILKKRGDFVFTVPSHLFGKYLYLTDVFEKWKMSTIARLYSNKRNGLLNHYHLYSCEEWKKRLKAHGLKIVAYSYYIDDQTLQLWDEIAWLVVLQKKILSNYHQKITEQFEREIKKHYNDAHPLLDKGASLLIHAQKK